MKNLKLLFFVFPIFLFSCGDDIADVVVAFSSSFSATVSGDITSTFDGEADFVHSILNSQPAGQNGSVISIGLENKNDSKETIFLSVFESDNTTGITEGTYNYEQLLTDLIVQAQYSSNDGSGILPVVGKTNQIIFTSITDTKIKGSYNFTLADPLGSEITISGTFDALGVTTTN